MIITTIILKSVFGMTKSSLMMLQKRGYWKTPEIVSKDLSKVSRNNDIYKEVCKKDKSMVDKLQDKTDRILKKP